jgi:ABC-type sugar transport system ATPase subunit
MFVAQFIGTPPMNTLPGTVSTAGSAGIDVGGGRMPLPAGLATRVEEGQPVVVGVRPEHMSLADGGPVEHKVRAVEWLGHECLVFGTVGQAEVVVRLAGMAHLEPGGSARLNVDPAHVHLFDPDSGQRLT